MSAQKEAVAQMEKSDCRCIIYHPAPGSDDWNRVKAEFEKTRNVMFLAQLINTCPRQK
jgi:hypothetical protein